MRGDYQEALRFLSRVPKIEKKNYRFVYYLDKGATAFHLRDIEQSNTYFEKAYLFGEDYKKRLLAQGAMDIVNPTLKLYTGEKHEHLLLLYYKALNYMDANDYEGALVACRRLRLRLDELSDQYKAKKNTRRYARDAFVHTLMGLLYEADADMNNAFIAYRNAYEIYESDYRALFGMGAPEQLKKDLQRTAYEMGFDDELARLRKKMGARYAMRKPRKGEREVIVFWNNGLGPYKEHSRFTFAMVAVEQSGAILFQNDDLGFSFPFFYDGREGGLTLSTISVAFPRYVTRLPRYAQATLRPINSAPYPLEMVENVTKVAKQCLRDRMLYTFSTSLLRVALREMAEGAIRRKSEGLGILADLIGTASEQADTRGWQTLPHAIHYARITIPNTKNKQPLLLQLEGTNTASSDTLWIMPSKRPISFYHFSTTDTRALN